MKNLRDLVRHLADIPNPFVLPSPYILPQRDDRAADAARMSRDFRIVLTGLSANAGKELARHGVLTN